MPEFRRQSAGKEKALARKTLSTWECHYSETRQAFRLGSPMVGERTEALARAWPQFTTNKRGRGVPVGRDPTAYQRGSPGHTQVHQSLGSYVEGTFLPHKRRSWKAS